jgi:hypothetical protein
LDLEPSLQAKCPNSRCGVANDGFTTTLTKLLMVLM